MLGKKRRSGGSAESCIRLLAAAIGLARDTLSIEKLELGDKQPPRDEFRHLRKPVAIARHVTVVRNHVGHRTGAKVTGSHAPLGGSRFNLERAKPPRYPVGTERTGHCETEL
jgi:hypothetical protein